MELKPGYKQTEIGVIPDDWEILSVFDIAERQKARFDDGDWVEAEHITDKGIRLIQTGNIGIGNYVEKEKKKYIYNASFDLLRCKPLEVGDLLICRLAEPAGRACILPNIGDEKVITSVDVTIYRPDVERFDRGYLAQYFSTAAWFDSIIENVGGTTHKRISRSALGSIQIPIPTDKVEQSAIATALGDMDALLAAQDALIAKKRGIKQGAMQELLTGRRRLPGHDGEWVVRSFKGIAPLQRGFDLPTTELQRGDYPVIYSNGVLNRHADYQVEGPGVVTGRSGTIGNVTYVEGRYWPHNTALWVTNFKGNDPRFVFYLYQHVNLERFATGSGVPTLNRNDVHAFEVKIPQTKEEQTHIAELLSDMDSEIAMLEANREKTAQLKQGMMQELLTGRTRLLAPAVRCAESSATVIPFKTKRDNSKSDAIAVRESGGKQANVHFKRSVFAAEIVDQLHNEPTFGHVKFEKLIFLAEHLCRVDTGSNYHRDAAGPYDNRALRSIDSQLKKQKWFDAQKNGGRYQYAPLEKHGGHKEYFDRYYADIRVKLDEIIATFRTAKTDQCEIVATLYGAWDDLINSGTSVTDAAILDQVLNHWHDKKRNIPEERWRKALEWMREKGYVPGTST